MNAAPATANLIRRLALAGFLLCCVVVVLGAYVRLTAAGLGCPDWPGCYGHFTPTGAQQNPAAQAAFPASPLDVGKAWREMVHRYAAATLGLIIVVITALAIATRRKRIVPMGHAFALLGIVVVQGMLGMLTVTWNLKPLIVPLHLLFGLTTLGLLWWLYLSLRASAVSRERFLAPARPTGAWSTVAPRRLVLVALIALGLQIALGGWTSSNYAAVACPDFPKCQAQWWPETDYPDAFVLWRGLDINYEGGVLAHPARVAIHLTHRIGAVVLTTVVTTLGILAIRRARNARVKAAGVGVLVALGLQLLIGISMVVEGFPLWLATAHNAGAAILLLAVITLLRRLV